MAAAFLGLGTNLGDRRANLAAALAALAEFGTPGPASPVYETAPMHVADQPDFLNMAVRLDTALDPLELLGALKGLEAALGRVASERYGPRLIDIDILLYDDVRIDLPTLQIPHPRLAERRFALAPLADIAPSLIHPGLGRTIAELLAALPPGDGARRV